MIKPDTYLYSFGTGSASEWRDEDVDMDFYGILGGWVKEGGEMFGFLDTFSLVNSNLPKDVSPR